MILLPTEARVLPRLSDYHGVWCIEADHFMRSVDAIAKMDISRHILEHRNHPPVNTATVRRSSKSDSSSIGVVELTGTLMKHTSSVSDGTSTVMARRAIRQLADDPSVGGILIHIDSHGGTSAGNGELGDEIARASTIKPTHAFIEDHGFSAAYWAASQAGQTTINPYGFSGSIGTYGIVVDSSQKLENEGLKVHVVSTGEFKGAGTPGTPITESHLAQLRAVIESVNNKFLAAVSKGREISMDKLKEIADGRTFDASGSKELMLVDSIGTIEEALESLMNRVTSKVSASVPAIPVSTNNEEGEITMSETVAATIEEIKGICKNAPAEFILSQLTAGATKDQVKDAWIEELSKGSLTRQTVSTTAVKESTSTTSTQPTLGDLDDEVREYMRTRRVDRRTAVRAVLKSNKEAHRQFLKENSKNRSPFVQMAIDAKFQNS